MWFTYELQDRDLCMAYGILTCIVITGLGINMTEVNEISA